MAEPTVWLIGENNPYQIDPVEAQRYALYPEPLESAGARLAFQILDMDERVYLRSFNRRNLLAQARWSVPAARAAAAKLVEEIPEDHLVVLFGRRVWDAWSPLLRCTAREWAPFCGYTRGASRGRHLLLALPHPSGLNRMWGEPGAFARARAAIGEMAPHLRPLLGVREVRRAG